MKLLLLAPDVDMDKPSGGSVHYTSLCKALSRYCNVVLVGYGAHEKIIIDESAGASGMRRFVSEMRTYPWIRNPLKKGFAAAKRMDKLIEELAPDVLYYRVEPFEAFGLLTKARMPKIIEFNYNFFARHQSGAWTRCWWLRNFLLKQWLKAVVKRFNASVCVSSSVRQSMERHGIKSFYHIVPNGADIKKFRPGRRLKPVKIVFVGGAGKHQGADLLVKAAELLKQRNVSCKIIIAGGFPAYSSFVSSMKKYAEERGIDNAEFSGMVDDVPGLLKNAEIGVAPFRDVKEKYGFSPLKVFEYMASGLAVVASDTEWNKEIISSLLFKEGNEKDLADKLQLLVEQPALRKKLQSAARKEAVKYYNWDRAAKQVLGIASRLHP